MPSTIVVGYDGSPAARECVRYAVAHAGEDGRVVLVYAYGPPAEWWASPSYKLILEEHKAHGRGVLAKASEEMGDVLSSVDWETDLRPETAEEAIMGAADAHRADEIVVGSRGFGALRAVLGSVSHELLHMADRPVVVIPRP